MAWGWIFSGSEKNVMICRINLIKISIKPVPNNIMRPAPMRYNNPAVENNPTPVYFATRL